MSTNNQENMRTEYSEIGANFRTLADIRFKLLTIIPIGTILGAWFTSSNDYLINPFISLFGLVITLALMLYNERNDQHYGELISRAAEIERLLKLPDGQFNQRPNVWFSYSRFGMKISVTHGQPIGWIYKASLMLWLFGVVYPISLWLFGNSSFIVWLSEKLSWPPATMIAFLSIVISFLSIWAISIFMGNKIETRKKQMRAAAFQAMKCLNECAIPPEMNEQEKWLTILNMLAVVGSGKNDEKTLNGVLKKATYYVQDWPQNLGAADPDDKLKCTSLLAAAVSGQSARWFRDTYTGRSGKKTDGDGFPSTETQPQNFDQFFIVSNLSSKTAVDK